MFIKDLNVLNNYFLKLILIIPPRLDVATHVTNLIINSGLKVLVISLKNRINNNRINDVIKEFINPFFILILPTYSPNKKNTKINTKKEILLILSMEIDLLDKNINKE